MFTLTLSLADIRRGPKDRDVIQQAGDARVRSRQRGMRATLADVCHENPLD